MIELRAKNDDVGVYLDGAFLGTVTLYDNPYHRLNCYVKLNLKGLDASFSAELFEKLAATARRPLQAMAASDDGRAVGFLTAGGFVCRRRCYEVTAREADFIGAAPRTGLCRARSGDAEYDLCCRVMYGYYIETHRAVNPWTGEFADFCRGLPAEAAYEMDGGRVVSLAFVEGNEIAYVYTADAARFSGFAASLVGWIFSGHDTVCFECDDCDRAAMQLRSMFKGQGGTSFDTYVYEQGARRDKRDKQVYNRPLAKIK